MAEADSLEQAQDPAYRAMQAENHRVPYSVRKLCQVLGVAPSAYYVWRQRRQRPTPTWERAGSSPVMRDTTARAGCGLSCKLLAIRQTAILNNLWLEQQESDYRQQRLLGRRTR